MVWRVWESACCRGAGEDIEQDDTFEQIVGTCIMRPKPESHPVSSWNQGRQFDFQLAKGAFGVIKAMPLMFRGRYVTVYDCFVSWCAAT